MRTIKITASQKAEFVDVPYLFNVKERAHIRMDKSETIVPDKSEKLVLTCLLEPVFSEEKFMKSLSILYEGKILWTHNYVLKAQGATKVAFIAAGGIFTHELSKMRQVYYMQGNAALWSREECELRLRGNPMSFPSCDDRSLVSMVEAGEVKYEGLQSIMIRRPEPDSRFCDITFC